MSSSPTLEITPEKGLVDQPVSIRVSGLEPGRSVTLRAMFEVEGPPRWESEATFEANAEGIVDPAVQAPRAGTYDGVEAMGLFWSMAEVGGTTERFDTKRLVFTIQFTAEVDGSVFASKIIVRRWAADGVRRSIVRDDGLFGSFYEPRGTGPHPAVVAVGGSDGGLNEGVAALLASHGHAALALAYFAYESLPPDLENIPLEYFEKAIRWLQSHETIDGKRLAILGGSRGGELALLLGSAFPAFRAVVAYAPSSVVWGGGYGDFVSSGENPDEFRVPSSWTHRGKPVQFMSVDSAELIRVSRERHRTREALTLVPYFLAAMEDRASVEAASIAVENTLGAILLISGEDDRVWPSALFSELVTQRLGARGFAHPYEHICYPRAGHAIKVPYVPTTATEFVHPIDGIRYSLGGSARDNAFAGSDSWVRVLSFLDVHLRSI